MTSLVPGYGAALSSDGATLVLRGGRLRLFQHLRLCPWPLRLTSQSRRLSARLAVLDQAGADVGGMRQDQDMTQMNRDWAIGKLKGFLVTAAISYVPSPPNSVGFGYYKFNNPKPEVQAAAQIVERILDR